jgi:hypothetical protein
MSHFEALEEAFLSSDSKVIRLVDWRATKPFPFANISNFSEGIFALSREILIPRYVLN